MPPKGQGKHGGGGGANKIYFHIRSDFNGKVMDVQGGNAGPGAKVIMYDQNHPPSDNQLWFIGQDGFIKSKLNRFTLDCTNGAICLNKIDEGVRRNKLWVFKGNKIVNDKDNNKCIDIRAGNRENGAELVAYAYNNQDNQHWRMEPV